MWVRFRETNKGQWIAPEPWTHLGLKGQDEEVEPGEGSYMERATRQESGRGMQITCSNLEGKQQGNKYLALIPPADPSTLQLEARKQRGPHTQYTWMSLQGCRSERKGWYVALKEETEGIQPKDYYFSTRPKKPEPTFTKATSGLHRTKTSVNQARKLKLNGLSTRISTV